VLYNHRRKFSQPILIGSGIAVLAVTGQAISKEDSLDGFVTNQSEKHHDLRAVSYDRRSSGVGRQHQDRGCPCKTGSGTEVVIG
jgi:hypothetical protein